MTDGNRVECAGIYRNTILFLHTSLHGSELACSISTDVYYIAFALRLPSAAASVFSTPFMR
jgi:hypothetical protein